MNEQTAKKNQELVPIILWAALIMSVFMYLALTFLIPRSHQLTPIAVEHSTESLNETESAVVASDPGSIQPPFSMAAILYPFGLVMALAGLGLGHARPLWKDAASATRLQILSLAFCESCALMGFFIYLTGTGDATEPRSMMVMAIVCMVTLFPTPKRMRLA